MEDIDEMATMEELTAIIQSRKQELNAIEEDMFRLGARDLRVQFKRPYDPK